MQVIGWRQLVLDHHDPPLVIAADEVGSIGSNLLFRALDRQ